VSAIDVMLSSLSYHSVDANKICEIFILIYQTLELILKREKISQLKCLKNLCIKTCCEKITNSHAPEGHFIAINHNMFEVFSD